MATLGVKAPELTKFGELEAGNVYSYPEAAAQTFKVGDPVKLDTNGRVLIAVDTESGFWGIAWQDASGVTDTKRLILVVTPAMVFSASQSNDGAAQVTAQTQVGLLCSWKKSSVAGETTKTTVDTADVTQTHLTIIDLDSRDAVGDTNGRVLFRVEPTSIVARPS